MDVLLAREHDHFILNKQDLSFSSQSESILVN